MPFGILQVSMDDLLEAYTLRMTEHNDGGVLLKLRSSFWNICGCEMLGGPGWLRSKF